MVLVPIKKKKENKSTGGGLIGGFVASGLYRWFITSPLTGPRTNGRAAQTIPTMWPGDLERGREILDCLFEHLGEGHRVSIATALPEHASNTWLNWFHGFAWLADLKALGGSDAKRFARERISEWIAGSQTWNRHSWDRDTTATRISNWLKNWDFLVDGGPENTPEPTIARDFKPRVVASLVRDTRHLMSNVAEPKTGYSRLHGVMGFVVGAHGLFNKAKLKSESMKALEAEVGAQILPDGGHIERNPMVLALALNDLIEIKNMLAKLGNDVPGWLQNAIDRAAPMLRMLRHPDGGLALFNGAGVGDNGGSSLNGLEYATDTDTARQVNVLSYLGTAPNCGPGIYHSTFINICSNINI